MKTELDKKALIALGLLSITYGVAGIPARILHDELEIWQQVALVNWLGLFSTLLFTRLLGATPYRPVLSRKIWVAITTRAIAGRIAGSYFFVLACACAPLGNVAWISTLPASVIFDRLLWGKRISTQQMALLLIGSAGVGIIVLKEGALSLEMGWGEVYALIAVLLLGFSQVFGREAVRDTPTTTVAILTLLITALISSSMAIIFEGELALPSWNTFPVALLVGVLVLVSSTCSVYGFNRLPSSIATGIITLEAVWAVILGSYLYGEIPSYREWVGSVLIGGSAILLPFTHTMRRNVGAICSSCVALHRE